MRWIRKNFSTVLLLVTLMIGISLLLYPTISDYWNSSPVAGDCRLCGGRGADG